MSAEASPALELSLQIDSTVPGIPTRAEFERWAVTALSGRRERTELGIRIVGREESRRFNARYRQRDQATNVLSFPAHVDEYPEDLPVFGDLLICAEIVMAEAAEQGKSARAHWAHLVVHGVLHLLGFDHQNDVQAVEMESLEVELLQRLGIADPYGG